MHIDEIIGWLRETDESQLEKLYSRADTARREFVGEDVHLRGLIEVSNHCCRDCAYCGLRGGNHALKRYRMTRDEILAAAHKAAEFGYGTVVLQAGEDHGIAPGWFSNVIRRIKKETPLAVTLSMGERPDTDLEDWRKAGADRYLLRFETSDPELYAKVHPTPFGHAPNRIVILNKLRRLGYEVGSGVMVGIPGQSYRTLAQDIRMFRHLDLDMIGVGPFIPHPATPLGQGLIKSGLPAEEQVPATEEMAYKAVALSRLMCPQSNIPSTTAMATINARNGRELGLQRGANVVMPNLTPLEYRKHFEIYPGKACMAETADQCDSCIHGRIRAIGRSVGTGPGGRERVAMAV